MAHLQIHQSPHSSSGRSSDFSVSVDSDGDGDSDGDRVVSSSGNTDRNSSGDSTQGGSSVGRELDSCSTKPTKSGKSGQSHGLHHLLANIFDEKVSTRKKLRWLERVATVQDDGTVQMEVPEGIQPESFHFETDVLEDGAVDEPLDTPNVPVIPPLQIVMLIVGTRGDVQPFVAIGRRLQI